jgi:quercetin dioxygenase-like cupin family protein
MLFEKPGQSRRVFCFWPRLFSPLALASAFRSSFDVVKPEDKMPEAAKSTVFIDNEKVVVTEWRFAPGASTGWHRHGHDYVIVPLMDGRLKLLTEKGEAFGDMKAGVPYFREAGVEHDVVNANETEYAFIEIELK